MTRKDFTTWGQLAQSRNSLFHQPQSRVNPLPANNDVSMLAIGNLRCYGDEAFNHGGMLIDGLSLNKFIHFDRMNGYLTVECGVQLGQILDLIVPCGWFLAVVPGTKLVSVGGAIANDVHGKNHHKDGSFGCFVEELCLHRSSGEVLICSRSTNSEYFYATLGGMGLTGVISWARLKLIPITNSAIIGCEYRFANLQEYFTLNQHLEQANTYTVAWIDCLASGSQLGRGVYFTGEHAGLCEQPPRRSSRQLSVPIQLPFSLFNKFSLKLFNHAYYWRHPGRLNYRVDYNQFFFPLDGIQHWNRLYGYRGFYQYQVVIPHVAAAQAVTEILKICAKHQAGSFLAVLKTFGDQASGGMLSFPRPGVTLALDFANRGEASLKLFNELDQIVTSAHGAIYPAKDARMSAQIFCNSFPRLNEFIKYVDPQFESELWKRVYKGNN